jgi:hypothetical protein
MVRIFRSRAEDWFMPDIPIPVEKSDGKFFNLAAWYSLIAPPICFLIGWIGVHYSQHGISENLVGMIFLTLMSSFLGGIISLFGIPKCGSKKILWKAIIGIIASLVLGLVCFYGLLLIGVGKTP